tara:strand:+ start:46089 stop:46511 length:423 start_codon:yes stop_codon:yes gene_type:complete
MSFHIVLGGVSSYGRAAVAEGIDISRAEGACRRTASGMCRMKTTPDTALFRRVRAKMALLAACVSEVAICRVIVSRVAPHWRSGWGAVCHKFPEVKGPEHRTTPLAAEAEAVAQIGHDQEHRNKKPELRVQNELSSDITT